VNRVERAFARLARLGPVALGALLALLVAAAWAGTTNLDSLTLSDDLIVTDTATFSGATTVSGALAISGAQTVTADVTLSGSGTDLLFNAANQNTIGAAAAGAKAVYTRAVTNETGQALTVTGASGISLVGATTVTGNVLPEATGTRSVGSQAAQYGAFELAPLSNPLTTSSTATGEFWLTNATPGAGKTAWKVYVFINGSWTALH